MNMIICNIKASKNTVDEGHLQFLKKLRLFKILSPLSLSKR